MTKHKYTRAFTRFWQKVVTLNKTATTPDPQWFLRILLISSRRHLQGGFVLPTTVMVILVVTLAITALVFRTFSRTSQVISERKQQVIYNSATPAIERAKSKLEYLFRQDTRLPAGIPSDSVIQSILQAPATGTADTYTLPGETRLVDFKDPDNNPGIGWYFQENGKTIVYSIIFKKQVTNSSGTTVANIRDNANTKADYLVVRNGPVNTNKSSTTGCGGAVQLASNERDWEPITSATLAKTFQITAFVVENANTPNRTVATLELQQDKQADKGNKWGAYFRYDLELFNAPTLRWNGAMHSDGNFFFGPFGTFRSYLISSTASCVNTSPNDSKVTTSRYTDQATGNVTFQGQFIAGRLNLQQFGGDSRFDLYNANGTPPTEDEQFKPELDSIELPSGSTINPDDLALDPVALFTQDIFKARGTTDSTNTSYLDPQWKTRDVYTKRRIFDEATNPPYLDDTYRADDRYGPNPTYDGKPITISQVKIPSGSKVGDVIPTTDTNYTALTRNTPPDPKSPEALGLDGYWERRAVTGGLRVLVGQRLELGNPLAPASNLPSNREHEFLQRRTQRDNVAAVQATAVYHYKSANGTTPVACVATTVHPGTAETLKRSATFETIKFKTATGDQEYIINDFFTGRGTNGWEFSVPTNSTALAPARQNLANFAGDTHGAFPPKQDTAASQAVAGLQVTHPYPEFTSYGDFSNLRRSLTGTSIADQSYRDTANCLLGMLAYNISYLNDYDYAQNWDNTNATVQLLDNLDAALAAAAGTVGARDPERAIKALQDNITSTNNQTYLPIKKQLIQLARLIATKEQVDLDRQNALGYTCDNAKFINAAVTALDKLCPSRAGAGYSQNDVKYKALYYIFPFSDHPEDRSDSYITGINPVSLATRYQAISNTDLSTIKIIPQALANWKVPKFPLNSTQINSIPGQPDSLPNSNKPGLNNLIKYVDAAGTETYYQVPFKDAALFNGREMMSVRVLDIDLDLLRSNNAPGGDQWLPTNDNTATDPNAPPPNGIVYAFREDAVREDAIARPAGSGMNAIPGGSSSDPDISTVNPTGNGITTKPVDYLPDPDRRPYGFRLKNGSNISRGTNTAGMSFVSDNPVYIQGDLNLHSTDGTNNPMKLLEEFKNDPPENTIPDNNGKLKDDWSNFYTRDRKDDRFAKPTDDTWRPTEVLGDSVTVLSNNFCDGSIEDGIIYPGIIFPAAILNSEYGCDSAALFTSYLNQNRPSAKLADLNPVGTSWLRENPLDSGSPIKISPDGKPWYKTSINDKEYELIPHPLGGTPPSSYLRFADNDPYCGVPSNRKCVGTASTTRVNAIIVQNIIPSRAGQSYGGFHMFPRMIENWDGKDLFMAGAFIQLRFSTQATGPFDQDAWEPSQTPLSTGNPHEYNFYFLPPNRRWGYDVALQYQTAGPVARRFSVPGNTRSEVYRELAVDDPYIQKLRCAKDSAGNQIDPTASCS
ncbi:hormogonium polysaccharide biosynthesis protein HpsA [Iningainema tapete]|uniref:Uncharacterized protein n=1 Tax=Iningainema tapete BLCC-T55 TaxID=2748662 RepID=A0A8J7CAK9_9CYAN|nr:hormogonium polysaccharide biosynthesis protein HpsA [Iningainema tapete]MBD2771465.1 hypothetical protein [Iningainema tapete BLCC-T55]